MPVVVTGASGLVGRHAVAAFAQTSPQVRAYLRRPDTADALRKLGAKVAIGEITDVDRLEAVMSGAHTVCHLVGSANLLTEEGIREANLDPIGAVVSAAVRAGIRRVLFASCVGADSRAKNLFLRAKGIAEEVIRASGLDHAIIRSTLVVG